MKGAGVRFGDLWALRDIDLQVRPGERVALIGPSGSGKTTLLGLLNGTLQPSAGTVEVFGSVLSGLRGNRLRAAQARIGTIHQDLDLVGPLRVIHNVNAGRLAHWSAARAAISLLWPREVHSARSALARTGIAHKLYERTDRLSGGERQRVALARVLVQDAGLVLADEPVSSLDPARGAEVMDLLRDLTSEPDRTLIASLHLFEFALSHCDRVVGLRSGRMVFDLPPGEVDRALAEHLYRIEPEAG